jgi:signal transduction histidine kinase
VPNLEPVQPAALVRDVLRDHRQAASESGISFHIDAKNLPQVTTDVARVRQILENLVSNAIRYSPPHGRVTVRARLREGRRATDPATWLRLDVVDQGPGVSEEQGVFEEVERVAREAAPGLRLVISRRTARLLGGDLTLQTKPGTGATFSLWLPVTPAAAPTV